MVVNKTTKTAKFCSSNDFLYAVFLCAVFKVPAIWLSHYSVDMSSVTHSRKASYHKTM